MTGLNTSGAAALWFYVPKEPPTANRIWRNTSGRQYLTKAARDFKKQVAWSSFGVRIPQTWSAVNVRLWVRPSRRAGDVDNKIKIVLDAITAAGVWPDDKIVAGVGCSLLNPDGGAPCVVVCIAQATDKYENGEPWREYGAPEFDPPFIL